VPLAAAARVTALRVRPLWQTVFHIRAVSSVPSAPLRIAPARGALGKNSDLYVPDDSVG